MYRGPRRLEPIRLEIVNIPCKEIAKLTFLLGTVSFLTWQNFKDHEKRIKKLEGKVKALEGASKDETEMLDKDILEEEFLK